MARITINLTKVPGSRRYQQRLVVRGLGFAGFGIGFVAKGEEARKVNGGPMVPGPWAFAYGKASVLDNHGGTGAEIRRERELGLVYDAAIGDVLIIEDIAYRIDRAPNDNVDLIPVEDK